MIRAQAVDSHAHVFCANNNPFAADREYAPHPTQLGRARAWLWFGGN